MGRFASTGRKRKRCGCERDWKERNDLTIHVGLGSGGKTEQIAQLTQLGNWQKELLLGGFSNIITPMNLYNSMKALVKLLGHKDTDAFVTAPSTQPAPQGTPDPKMLQVQMQADLQQQKQQTDAAHQQMKTRADIALAERKAQLEEHKALLEAELRRMETNESPVRNSPARARHEYGGEGAANRLATGGRSSMTWRKPHSPACSACRGRPAPDLIREVARER